MAKTKFVGVDTETKGIKAAYDSTIPMWMASFSYPDDVVTYDCRDKNFLQKIQDEYNKALKNNFVPVFHNCVFDVRVLRSRGISIPPGTFYDTMIMAYCLTPTSNDKLSLENLSQKLLGYGKLSAPSFDEFSIEMIPYCEGDAIRTRKIADILLEYLREDENALYFYQHIEQPYAEVVMELMTTGAHINKAVLQEEAVKVRKYLREQRIKLLKLIPRSGLGMKSINLESLDQVSNVLQTVYGWEPTVFTRTGKPTLTKATLETLTYPFAELYREYRKFKTYSSNFVEPLSAMDTELLHCNFNQCATRTGRLSSSKRNLQNIPVQGEQGETIRRIFTAPPGYKVVIGDLDRIELVMLAFYLEIMTGYTALSDRIRQHEDIHTSNTNDWSAIAGIELLRKKVKNGIFATIYGCGIRKFAATIGVTVEVAKKIQTQSELMTAINEMGETFIEDAVSNNGVFYSFFGRRLYVPEIMSRDGGRRASGERKILNYRIQGSSGDAFKILQLRARRALENLYIEWYVHQEYVPNINHFIVVHDESGYYVEEDYAQQVADLFTSVYSADDLLVYDDVRLPIHCKFNVGDNWYDAKSE